jgi:hypothetical protein
MNLNKSKKKVRPWDKKGYKEFFVSPDILKLPIVSKQKKSKNQCKQIFFLKLEKVIQFYYMNERYQVSCLSHNVNININVFGISMCLTQLHRWFSCNNSLPRTLTKWPAFTKMDT